MRNDGSVVPVTGGMNIKAYATDEELFEDLRRTREAADSAVGPEHTQYKVGTYYARFMPEFGFIIYGEIRDPIQDEIDAGADEEEVEFQRYLRAQSHMEHYKYTKSYSVACVEGEYGDVHVSTMNVPLTKEEFERAQDLGWPVHPKELFEQVLKLRKMREVPRT